MDQCSICLEDLDGGGVSALACGHRFHAACLAQMAGAVGTAATTSRRGTLTACPNCRKTSRVAPFTPIVAAFSAGDKVLAMWGHRWFPGVVDDVIDGGRAYAIAWDDGDYGEAPAAKVRAAELTVDVVAPTTRDASQAAVVTPRATPPVAPAPLSAPTRGARLTVDKAAESDYHLRKANVPDDERRQIIDACTSGESRVVRDARRLLSQHRGGPPDRKWPKRLRPIDSHLGRRFKELEEYARALTAAATAAPPPVEALFVEAVVPPPPPRALPSPLAAAIPPPPPRAIAPPARSRARPALALASSASRPHVASAASAWVAVCTDLLEVVRDHTNMKDLRAPLTSRGFHCGGDHATGKCFRVTVPPEFPCYYDVVGKECAAKNRDRVYSLTQLRKYLEGTLALARTGGAYRTDAEYKSDAQASAPVPAKTSRFTGVNRDKTSGGWRAWITVRGSKISLGRFDIEEDAARAFDAARAKWQALVKSARKPLNFPGEAPLESALAALPPLPSHLQPPPPPPPLPPPPRLHADLDAHRRRR